MKGKDQKRYSVARKLAALAVLDRNGGNLYQTMKETGIPEGTLSNWVKAQQEGRLPIIESALSGDASLDDQLEHLARQMVAVMPEKLDEASLQELARSLTIILDTLKETRTEKEKTSHAREKLAEILERYAAAGGEAGASETTDGG
ncbi:MAG: hypothetical protein U0521_21230 [Anaerolineae bacterium]